ncbi:MAG: hypothetical protein GY862_16710 [Gammaproteobacteria bacterium]|nr:hypothetical protein [Gammaproteobacteria bacterium]
MYMQHWPLGGAWMTVAAIACGMSTIDSRSVSISSGFTRNVAEPLLAEKLSETAEYRLAKGVSMLLLILVATLALFSFSMVYIAPLFTFGASIATFLLWPFVGMFVWKGATKSGVLGAMGTGFLTLCIVTWLPDAPRIAGFPIGDATMVFIASLCAFLLLSWVGKEKTA